MYWLTRTTTTRIWVANPDMKTWGNIKSCRRLPLIAVRHKIVSGLSGAPRLKTEQLESIAIKGRDHSQSRLRLGSKKATNWSQKWIFSCIFPLAYDAAANVTVNGDVTFGSCDYSVPILLLTSSASFGRFSSCFRHLSFLDKLSMSPFPSQTRTL